MTDEKTVSEIVQKGFKSGVSQKTNKPWILHKYRSGEVEFTSFQDLEIGDVVRLTQNEYGWSGAKPTVADSQHDEVMKAIRLVYKQNSELLAIIHELGSKQ